MTLLTTDLSHSPYWDDYNPNKQFYKILFVPKKAVQVREMNQLQTMIQQQISRFGNHVFKDGSVVTGCNIVHIPHFDYVRVTNFVDQSGNPDFQTETLKEFLLVSPTTGLRASINLVKFGYVGTYPDTSVFYVNYLNKGRDLSDNPVEVFQPGEILDIYTTQQDKFGTLNPGYLYNQIPVLDPGIDQQATGQAYGVYVGDGVVYQKGYFVNVLPHTILVKPYDTDVNQMMVGFRTNESIVTSYQDQSLIDPADTSNRNGIGANRLKLNPELISIHKGSVEPTDNFFPIIEFGNEQAPVKQNTDPAYAKLGEALSQRMYEESGDYYVKPFIVGTKQTANTQNFAYRIDPGIAYVKGNRVQLVGSIDLEAARATEVGFRNANITTVNYGNYVVVKELSGTFGAKTLVNVDIYDAAQLSITNGSGTGGAALGNKIGTARIRAVMWENGTKSTANCTYRLYITDIVMNSGKSFVNDAKSFYISSGNNSVPIAAKADIVLVGGKASIRDSSQSGLVFPMGVRGAKRLRDSQGANDTEYTFRDSSTATLQANGSVTFTLNAPYAGGIQRFFSSTGVVSAANKQKIDITTTANLITASNTNIVAGSVLNLANSTVTVVSNTQFVVDLGYAISSGAPQTLVATYPVIRSEANEIKKNVHRGTYVKIDCSSVGTTGPFNLGLVDIFSIDDIWVGTTYSESNPSRNGWFTLDPGQNTSSYEHGKLILKPEHQGKLSSASRILVKLNHFVANTATGIGFFSVDSYPVRAPGVAANSSNISYDDIPEVGGINLRNAIDYRPQKQNTANVSITEAGATVNPATTNNYTINGSGTYVGEPDSSMRNDLEYYLPRYDLIQVNKDGIFNIKSSIGADNPTVPVVDGDSMAIATSYVAPYPGITSDVSNQYLSTKPRISTKLAGNRGYTMKDIYGLDRRISVLEYYQSLSMLEQRAKDFNVKDENGLDRFKNGIFADPLKNHLLGDVSNFEYTIAIDELNEIARPKFEKNNVDLDVTDLNNVVVSGRIASLAYDRELFIEQPYASKFRNVTDSVWRWRGTLNLYPNYDHHRDETVLPEVNVNLDLSSPWEQFANSPFGQNFGDWRVISETVDTSSSGGWQLQGNWFDVFRMSQIETTTTTTSGRDVSTLHVTTATNTVNLGSYVQDITMSPYIRSRQVAFIATGLRPNTEVYPFFDDQSVSSYCAPGQINVAVYNQTTGEFSLSQGREDSIVTRTGDYGTPLVTDAFGNVCGIFNIPDQQFRVGDRVFKLVDIDDLDLGADAILTTAKAIYTASSLTISTNDVTITTSTPTLTVNSTTETIVDRSTIVQRQETSWMGNGIARIGAMDPVEAARIAATGALDPLGQSFYCKTPVDVPGAHVEAIGVFFRSKDPTLGITCYITEMSAGVPNSSRVLATSYLKPEAILTSNDGSAETIFKFTTIPYIGKDNSYAFFLQPDGDSPNYTLWMSEIGGVDTLTGVQIFSNPYVGVAFKSSNSESWDTLQTEDVKFNLYRCKFNNSIAGQVTFVDQEDEYLSTNGFAYTNTGVTIQPGDVVYTLDSNGNVVTGNSAPFAVVQQLDWVNDRLTVDSSTGGFAANVSINIYRPDNPSDLGSINANTLIASSTITSVDDIDYSIVVPRVAITTPMRTNVSFDFKGTDLAENVDSNWIVIQPETELEFIDKQRVVKSKSNRSSISKSVSLRATLVSAVDYISPTIDLRRRSLFAISNVINNDITNENTRHGNALSKYVSRIITLAEGQDAEDIRVIISAYRPVDTEVDVYAKILCADDPDDFYSKMWTKLDLVEGAGIRSSEADINDFREFVYHFPTTEQLQGTAWTNPGNDGIVQYRNAAGAIFVGYKQFALKFVLTASQKYRVPRVADIRGICLQT